MKIGLRVMLVLVAAFSGSALAATQLEFRKDVVLRGKLTTRTFTAYHAKAQAQEEAFVLTLDKPVDVVAAEKDRGSVTERDVNEITVTLNYGTANAHEAQMLLHRIFDRQLGQEVELHGLLLHAVSGEHPTAVVMKTADIPVEK